MDVVDSFNRLPHTEYKDGEYRLRRYSVVEVRTTFWNAREEIAIERLPQRDFLQSEGLNKHQGGMTRSFLDIEDEVLQSEGMKEICLTFKRKNGLDDGQEIEIHQMRVVTQDNGIAEVSPEGVHQDGFDYIAMLGINRYNIHGGELLAYECGPTGRGHNHIPFLTHALNDGEMLFLADRELWHNAMPITAGAESKVGHGDWFILCAKNKESK